MPLSKKIGYMLSNIEFLSTGFKNVKGYIDFIELGVSSPNIQNFIKVAIRATSSKGIKEFFNSGGFFNICLPGFYHSHETIDEKQICESFRKISSNFIREYNEAPSYFKKSCHNIILPVFIDGFSPKNQTVQELIVELLNELYSYSNDISGKFLLEYRIHKDLHDVRTHIKAFECFTRKIERQSEENLQLCLNFPQWYIRLGKKKFLDFLRGLRKTNHTIQEFHISDFKIPDNQIITNLTVGSGDISWRQFLPFFRETNLLLATNGGTPSIKGSLAYLGDISLKKRDRIDGNSIVTGFYFTRDKKSFFQTSPGIKRAQKYLLDKNLNKISILDLGCGNGRNSFFLSKNFETDVHLIDIDRDLLNYVQGLFQIFNVKPPKIDVVDLENIDSSIFRKEYDVTLLSYVLQNIRPEYYFTLMDFCREITKEMMIFEIYVNKSVYPEGVVTQRGENFWYGFSREEVFKLFETFFNVMEWDIKKGKSNPLMISLLGTPRSKIKYDETMFNNYQNVTTIDYSSLKSKLNTNLMKESKKRTTVEKTEIKNLEAIPRIVDPWKNLTSHLLGTGITNDQITILNSNFKRENSKINLKHLEKLGATLFLTARQYKIPIHLQEIAKAISVSKKDIYREIKKLHFNADYEKTYPSLEAFFERYFRILNLNEIFQGSPQEIINEIKNNYNCNLLGSLPHISALAIAVHLSRSNGRKVSTHRIANQLYISPSSLKVKLQSLESIHLISEI